MSMGRIGALRLAVPLLVGIFAGLSTAVAAASVTDAVALYRQKRFPEARAILEPLVAAQPSDPAATYYLGMACLRAGGPASLDEARHWLGRAVKLAPDDARYLADYAGVCLLTADRDNSLSYALEGKDAMVRAIAVNPRDLSAREGLMEFYAKAPWPLGDPGKALSLAAGIAALDPGRGAAAYRKAASIFEAHGLAEQARTASQAAQNLAPGHS
jgi:tetratricopeptide (TPR) repeat protein